MIPDDDATAEHLATEIEMWRNLLNSFNDRSCFVRIGGEDRTDDYRKWAQTNFRFSLDALTSYYERTSKYVDFRSKEKIDARLKDLRARLTEQESFPLIELVPRSPSVKETIIRELRRQITVLEELRNDVQEGPREDGIYAVLMKESGMKVDLRKREETHSSGARATFHEYNCEEDWLASAVVILHNPNRYSGSEVELARLFKEAALKAGMKAARPETP